MSIQDVTADSVNYDDVPLAELALSGVDYRMDAGHGSILAISQRATGSWDWAFLSEARWDGSRLRAKGLGFELSSALASALQQAMTERAD
jgi:hypothetical protein